MLIDKTRMTDHLIEPETAAGIAGRILVAWHSGQCAGLEEQLERGRGVMLLSSIVDACEMEKLEALEGALECLQSAQRGARSLSGEIDGGPLRCARSFFESGGVPHARVRAAIRLLEHLAIQSRAEN